MTKILEFRKLHEQNELLFLPNAWDLLSALVMEQSGFKAIGTTSWGVSNAHGYKDGENIAFDDLISLVAKMTSALNIPVTVDMESGYAENHDIIADNVVKIAEVGAVGINIEDSLKNQEGLNSACMQSKLIETVRNRLEQLGFSDFYINARIDTYFQIANPLNETIVRANDYVNSGASGVFVPGLSDVSEIREVVSSVAAPVNLLSLPQLTDIKLVQELGVKRFSIGNSLSDATISFMEQKAREILTQNNTSSLYNNGGVTTTFS